MWRHPGIFAKRRKIDFLRCGPGKREFQKPAEGLQVADIDNLPHVALYVGGNIVCQPLVGRDFALNSGISNFA